MRDDLLLRLLGIFAIVAIGWIAGRQRWLEPSARHAAPGPARGAEVLSSAAFLIFMPALLFRTTAQIDLAGMPWAVLLAFFVPVLGLLVLVYGFERRRSARLGPNRARPADVATAEAWVASPAVRAISVGFGNTVQLGIPVAAALFGPVGLAVHLAVVSLHALALLIASTLLVETALAHDAVRQGRSSGGVVSLLLATVRRTVIHPVVLPVVAGLLWNLAGLPLPGPLDEALALLAQAAVPLCLVLIGLSFAEQGLRGTQAVLRPALAIAALKLFVQPACVLAACLLLRVPDPALAVLVMCAALPTGSNALIFAQRYRSRVGEVTVTTVLSTLAYVLSAPLWLLLGALGRL